MDIVGNFKNYLLTQKNPSSPLTIKNYLSDVRRFLQWYKDTFNYDFYAEALTSEIVSQYQKYILSRTEDSLPAASSAKRYISSLRKFSAFLEHSGAIKINPFSLIENNPQTISDPFYIKEFKNFLFSEHASKLTIKNYIMDINQFLDWLDHIIPSETKDKTSKLIQSIDNSTLEQYKKRLFNEAKLSPVSINRKLSSLRRYIKWLSDKGILEAFSIQFESEAQPTKIIENLDKTVLPELPLTVLQGIAEEKKENQPQKYSNFPPFRLIQKSNKAITLGLDLLLFNPITSAVEAIHYSLWKNGKKTIFSPVTTILETQSYIPKGVSIKTIIPKQSSIMPPRSANLASTINKVQNATIISSTDAVKNFPKKFYAPLQLSTKEMSWQEKLLHNIKYTRPDWYKRYHTYAFVHYLHIGILIIATVIAGKLLYQTWYGENPNANQAVLSAQDTAPPRMLSFNGRLLDNDNNPITAETPLRFALYNSPTASGSALLWQEEQEIKPDQSGSFSTTLGENVRLNQSIFTNNPSLYVGISVGDNQELSPRQQIPTTDYAANSQSVEGLKPITDSPSLAQNVLLALDSSGNLTIGGDSSHTFQATGGQFNLSGQVLSLTTNPGSNGNITISPDGSGIIDLEKPIQNTSNSIGPGGVAGAVEVDDILSVQANESSQSALIVNQNDTGDIISGMSHGTDKFRLDNNGNEFIGGNLILNGDTIGTNSTVFDIGGSNVNSLSLGNSAKVITLGSSNGITSVESDLSVQGTTELTGPVTVNGSLTANAGITIPNGQTLTLANFAANGIPFLNSDSQVVEDANNFLWNDSNDMLTVTGTICVQAPNENCGGASTGTIYAASYQSDHADLAENYVSSQTLKPGDVVVLEGQGNSDAIIQSTSPYQQQLLGIVSTNPGMTLNSEAKTSAQYPNIYPLALQGRVPVNVSSINGPIEAGDDITSSSIPGVAMKATQSGQIIGKALESYSNSDPNAVGQIMVFVNLSYQSFPTTLTADGDLAAASESGALVNPADQPVTTTNLLQSLSQIANTISLGAVQAQTLTTQSLAVATDNITIGGQTLKQYITAIVDQIIDQEFNKHLTQLPHTTEILSPIASNSAQSTNQSISQIVTPIPTATISATPQIANSAPASPSSTIVYNIYNSIATQSAEASEAAMPTPTEELPTPTDSVPAISSSSALPDIQENEVQNGVSTDINNNQYEPTSSLSAQLTHVQNLQSDFGTFTQGLIALGPTSLTDVAVGNEISINNNLKITSDSINTIGTNLSIEPLRQGSILFMGGLVAIDTQGNLNVNGNANFAHNVTVNGQLAAGIIAPIPNNDLTINLKNKADKTGSSLVITNATGSAVLKINQSGDLASSGSASFNSVSSNGFSIVRGAQADTSMTQTVANGSAGTGVITAYETERTIITPYVTDHSLIYITPTSNTDGATPYLARQTAQNSQAGAQGSFTVALPTTSTNDVGFNWWIVN